MGSVTKSIMIAAVLRTIADRALDSAARLRAAMREGLIRDVNPDFDLLRNQLRSLELHLDLYQLALELLEVVPKTLEGTEHFDLLTEIADLQETDLAACVEGLKLFEDQVKTIWVTPVVAVTDSPSVEKQEDPEGSEVPFDEAVEQASRAKV